jgi:Ca-activated chloride channel family protein
MKQWPVKAPILTTVLVAWLALAQEQNPAATEYRIRTTAELVLLDVAAENAHGKPIAGLTKDSFKVFENGKLQPIHSFNHNDNPVSVGLVVDQSGSMRPKQREVLNAALAFVRASNPQDELFVVNFNDTTSLGLPPGIAFTANVGDLENAISSTRPDGRTALNDAVILALDHVAMGTRERKALLVISDGGDNASTHSEAQMMSKAEEVQATIYTIGLFTDEDEDRNPGLLRRLAVVSGGETYLPSDPSGVGEILRHIANEIRSRYSIGYTPARTGSAGGLRKVKVDAVDEKGNRLVVHTRTRYRLPDLDGTFPKGSQP